MNRHQLSSVDSRGRVVLKPARVAVDGDASGAAPGGPAGVGGSQATGVALSEHPEMNFFSLRVGQRLWLFVGLFALLVVSVVGIAGRWLYLSDQEAGQAIAVAQRKVELSNAWLHLVEVNVGREYAAALSTEPAVHAAVLPLNEANVEKMKTDIKPQIAALATTDAEKAMLQAIDNKHHAVRAAALEIAEFKHRGDADGARAALETRFLPAINIFLPSVRDFIASQRANADAVRERVLDDRRRIVGVAGALIALVVAAAVAGTLVLQRSIHVPLLDAMRVAETIATGDLTQPVESARRDEFGDLLRALARMQDALREVVGSVRSGTEGIHGASREIAAASHDLSRRTEESAANLQQTAASMEQLTGTVRQSADSARQADERASAAAGVAAHGGALVQQVVTTMDAIHRSSTRIAEIIGVIDGIAFQTNILALNAAVEAARAGESGRGFAVVAGEVRALAQRSAQAATEIKSLIGASVERVESGSQLVADAGKTMHDIVEQVGQVADLVGQISASTAEQSDGLAQVNVAVAALDRMTQQNAALVEQSSAAATGLEEQSVKLAELVARFRLQPA
ncbi:hypothetical protein CKO43_21610 [Rubrivivax gelatinosus]|uniref:Methyl-accepting chemotaxis protein n=2 Tax=Rubrivivax gelatinosus TaxID=28068 RepID=A0ABS1DZ83_RUBGE|nr:hypothetical protein [Rubrivivax gelatinosus]